MTDATAKDLEQDKSIERLAKGQINLFAAIEKSVRSQKELSKMLTQIDERLTVVESLTKRSHK